MKLKQYFFIDIQLSGLCQDLNSRNNLINFTYKQEDKIYQNALKAIMIIFSAYAYFVDRQIIHYLEISLLNGIEMLR